MKHAFADPSGEAPVYEVYRITWSNDWQYVGITRMSVSKRINRHEAIERPPVNGIQWYAETIAMGLTEKQARELELIEIGRLKRPLNIDGVPPKKWWYNLYREGGANYGKAATS